jgi:rubrerythrin
MNTERTVEEALDDEHRAHATYSQVLADFGDVLPFANIIEAEARHIDALTRVMQRHQVPVPSNPWTGKVPRFASVAEACAAGVKAEIDNGTLYDRLMATTRRPDILDVFRSLKEASQQHHLPAFHRCVERSNLEPGRIGGRR